MLSTLRIAHFKRFDEVEMDERRAVYDEPAGQPSEFHVFYPTGSCK